MTQKNFPTKESAIQAAQHALYQILRNTDQPLLFLSSGGSALALLETPLLLPHAPNLTLGVVDERYSHSATISNFLQLQTTMLYQSLTNQGAHSISSIPKTHESLESWAMRYETSLYQWITQHPNGKIIATLGMGTDGHIAGIFPETDSALFDLRFHAHDRLACAYHAPLAPQCTERLTITWPLLQKTTAIIALVCGADKKAALDRAFSAHERQSETPAAAFQHIPNLTLYTDQNFG